MTDKEFTDWTKAASFVEDDHPPITHVDGQREFSLLGLAVATWTRTGEANVRVGIQKKLVQWRQITQLRLIVNVTHFDLPCY